MRKAVTGGDGLLFKWKGTRTTFGLGTRTVIFFVPEHVIIILAAGKSERLYYKTVTVRKFIIVRVPNLTIFLKQVAF